MSVKMVVRPHGIQNSYAIPTPLPFDIKRDLLSGSEIDTKMLQFMVRCHINKMAPVTGGNDLINWFEMSSSQLLTAVLAYTNLNASKNKQGDKLTPFKPITDAEVKKQIEQMIEIDGFISPVKWEERFPSLRIKRN